ncbi:vegetative cell wall protein gp1-like [Triticum urartu]|uniref:vegetative cell wall protein gp1-like n=1 Tax=Triticum urartu TaxID=4572 RepID=UPI002042E84A|nr:vegetative cell wall protein gp1-like [Triticum urartu]
MRPIGALRYRGRSPQTTSPAPMPGGDKDATPRPLDPIPSPLASLPPRSTPLSLWPLSPTSPDAVVAVLLAPPRRPSTPSFTNASRSSAPPFSAPSSPTISRSWEAPLRAFFSAPFHLCRRRSSSSPANPAATNPSRAFLSRSMTDPRSQTTPLIITTSPEGTYYYKTTADDLE